MMWLENIKQWFVENSTYILSFLTPANIIAAIAAIVVAIRNNKATKKTTEAGTSMAIEAGKISTVATSVKENTEAVEKMTDLHWDLDSKVKSLYCKIENVQDDVNNKFDELEDKMNAILTVQSMVYGTIQNGELRQNVQNLIANAKIASDNTRAKLKETIEDLKEKILVQNEEVANVVKQTAGHLESVVSTEKKSKASRY